MKVAILGAGAVGLATAAVLCDRGHHPTLWSPSGRLVNALAAGNALQVTGAFSDTFQITAATSCEAGLRGADVVVLAMPCELHRSVIEEMGRWINPGQIVVISSHCSLGALYLSQCLAMRGVSVPIIALGTTIAYSRRDDAATVHVWFVRKRIEFATLSAQDSAAGLAICNTLFGEIFVPLTDIIAATLSNVNGQAHLGMILCNFTRMEKGEAWHPFGYATESVARLLGALDAERLRIAAAFGTQVQSFAEFLHFTYDTALAPLGEMFQAMYARGDDMAGPSAMETRWITQDIPFIIAVTVRLAEIADVSVPLHRAGIEVFSALYGRDLRQGNDLLTRLGLEDTTVAALRARVHG
jgi:opine dehydrogenase